MEDSQKFGSEYEAMCAFLNDREANAEESDLNENACVLCTKRSPCR